MKNFGLRMMILVLLCLVSVMNISVIADSVGVRSGDHIEYGFTYVGEIPPGSPAQIDWFKLEFLSVEGEMVYIRATVKFVNSSEVSPLTATVDLFSANWMHTGFVIPANSEVGDTVFVEGVMRAHTPPIQAVIEGEEIRACLGVNRTVVYAIYSLGDGPHMEPSSKVYWDKESGILVEGIYYTNASEGTWATVVEVTATNMWVHDLQFLGLERWKLVTIIVVVAGAVVIAIALILYSKKSLEGGSLPRPPRASKI